jgi:hypothetical protein
MRPVELDDLSDRVRRVVAELIATPAAPKPWSRRICTNTPPAEWPIRIGGDSSSPTTVSRCSMICGTVTAVIAIRGIAPAAVVCHHLRGISPR